MSEFDSCETNAHYVSRFVLSTVAVLLLISGFVLQATIVERADAAPGDIVASVTIPSLIEGRGLTFDGVNFWMTDEVRPGEIYNVDVTGTVLRTLTFPGGIRFDGLAWDGRYLWAGAHSGLALTADIYKIDPVTASILDTFPVAVAAGDSTSGLAYHDGRMSLWHNNYSSDVLESSTLGAPLSTFSIPPHFFNGEASDGVCLFSNSDGTDTIIQTMADGTPVATYALPASGSGSSYIDLAFDEDTYAVPVVWAMNDLPFGSGSGSVADQVIAVEVTPCPDDVLSVNWDYYHAECVTDGIAVNWSTLSESDTLGFRVKWSESEYGPFDVVSPVIGSRGAYYPYSWTDTNADSSPATPRSGIYNWYQIQELTSSGLGDSTESFTTDEVCGWDEPRQCGGIAGLTCGPCESCALDNPRNPDSQGVCVPDIRECNAASDMGKGIN